VGVEACARVESGVVVSSLACSLVNLAGNPIKLLNK
jgi:hypothetical protein